MSTITLAFGIFALAMGGIIWGANPRRRLNQVLFGAAFIQFVWMGCVFCAMRAGARGDLVAVALWLKLNALVSAFFPLGICLTKEWVVAPQSINLARGRLLLWSGTAVMLCTLACHSTFLIQGEDIGHFHRGASYYMYQLIAVPVYIWLIIDIVRSMTHLDGMKRIEMQFFSLNLAIAALLAAGFTTFGNIIDSTVLKRMSIVVVLVLYLVTGWAITTHRIFDFRQVLMTFLHRVGLIAILASGIAVSTSTIDDYVSPTIANALSVAACTSIAFWIEKKSKVWFDIDGGRQLAALRSRIISASLSQADSEKLITIFKDFFKQEHQTNCVVLQFEARPKGTPADKFIFTQEQTGYRALCRIGWATPESLERRRADAGLKDLHGLMLKNDFGAIVISPAGTNEPSLIVAVGKKIRMWPYTFPEVQRIQNVADLIDSTISRSRLASQVLLQTRVEDSEMMSRGLAHDLRNLMTPVSSFLVHTENQLIQGTPEAEVHSIAKRSVHVMGEYIRETLFFSRQLALDLSIVNLDRLLGSARDLTATQAKARGVSLITVGDRLCSISGDFVLLQRLLVNLVNNAIDASAPGQIVLISSERMATAGVILKVADRGIGIREENLANIFRPYFTTKDKGGETRGLGLGLAICRKIVELHGGSISVESSLGSGSLFAVRLPLPMDASKSTM